MEQPQQWPTKFEQSGMSVSALDPEDTLANNNNNTAENFESNSDEKKCDKHTRLQQKFEPEISEETRTRIHAILKEVSTLQPAEKLLLYLKLPTDSKETTVDPLRQPLNPLGSRSEISQTIMWIKTHLEEDPDISLQKKGVYDEYKMFCDANNIKNLSTADFGKVMKQVYPKVRPRRLGTRGNSQYCYSGLRKRVKLPEPTLPDLSDKPQSTESFACGPSDLLAAAWIIVKEWSECQLNMKFESFQALAYHLITKSMIGMGTKAAALITTDADKQMKADTLTSYTSVSINKHRETTLQLQRKIQQKSEINKEQKRKLQSPKCDLKARKKCKTPHPPQQLPIAEPTEEIHTTINSPTSSAAPQGLLLQTVCDKPIDVTNKTALPDFSSFQKSAGGTDAVPDGSATTTTATSAGMTASKVAAPPVAMREDFGCSPNKVAIPRLQTKHSAKRQPNSNPTGSNKHNNNYKYKAIKPKPEPEAETESDSAVMVAPAEPEPCDNAYNPQLMLMGGPIQPPSAVPVGDTTNRSQGNKKIAAPPSRRGRQRKGVPPGGGPPHNTSQSGGDDHHLLLNEDQQSVILSRERLISVSKVSKDALDDYLGSGNSQEHEEELMQYFENNNPQAAVLGENAPAQIKKHEVEDKEDQITQLRQLLLTKHQQHQDVLDTKPASFVIGDAVHNINVANGKSSFPSNTNARRRVSFDTQTQVPPSPNTRRKNFNFTPISPGPLSPKCPSSTNASPFVSPRNTPVLRARVNSHPYIVNNNNNNNMNLNLNNLNQPPQMHCGMYGKRNFRAKVDIDSGGTRRHVTISAPPSPKSTMLQDLLLNKTQFGGSYDGNQTVQTQLLLNSSSDTLCAATIAEPSNEVSLLMANNALHHGNEMYRSQSVPLHALPNNTQGYYQPEFVNYDAVSTLSIAQSQTATAEQGNFNEVVDPFVVSTASVDEIIDTIDNNGSSQDNNNVDIEDHIYVNANRDDFVTVPAPSSAYSKQNPPPALRWSNRSLSFDYEDVHCQNKCPPYRSVPSTPVPSYSSHLGKQSLKLEPRSYPSTPLANEIFNYNQDCLLNGQPIKEKLQQGDSDGGATSTQTSMEAEEQSMDYDNKTLIMDILHESNLPPSDGLLADKTSFNFDSSIGDGFEGSKGVVGVGAMEDNDGCDLMSGEYFKGVQDMNGT